MLLNGKTFKRVSVTSFRMTVTSQNLAVQFMDVSELGLQDDPAFVLLDDFISRTVPTNDERVAPLRTPTDIHIKRLAGRDVDYHEIYRKVLYTLPCTLPFGD